MNTGLITNLGKWYGDERYSVSIPLNTGLITNEEVLLVEAQKAGLNPFEYRADY